MASSCDQRANVKKFVLELSQTNRKKLIITGYGRQIMAHFCKPGTEWSHKNVYSMSKQTFEDLLTKLPEVRRAAVDFDKRSNRCERLGDGARDSEASESEDDGESSLLSVLLQEHRRVGGAGEIIDAGAQSDEQHRS